MAGSIFTLDGFPQQFFMCNLSRFYTGERGMLARRAQHKGSLPPEKMNLFHGAIIRRKYKGWIIYFLTDKGIL